VCAKYIIEFTARSNSTYFLCRDYISTRDKIELFERSITVIILFVIFSSSYTFIKLNYLS